MSGMATGIGIFYLFCGVINFTAALLLWLRWQRIGAAAFWLVVSMAYVITSAIAMGGDPPGLPTMLQDTINLLMNATTYVVGSFVVLVVLFAFRRFFAQPMVAWALLNLSLIFVGLAMTNPNFALIVAKPDNVPIVAMIYLLGFFTWLATWKAVQNDDRLARGLEPLEKADDEKVLVWPDLVYTELICMVVLTVVLIVWSVGLQAPLEEPGSAVKTPNPSKAPWYFLGLQEMLVYYDPWMAGVVLPSLVIVGLMAIPYLDFNKAGNGYYTIDQRKFAYLTFQFGFLELWVVLIIMGTFLRGPNWNFFGPFEEWDVHKVEALNNVDLSEFFWIRWTGWGIPRAPVGSDALTQLGFILRREFLGILIVLGYFVLIPPIMAATVFRKYFVKMGFLRYMVLINLLLFMALLPIKMVLRWTVNLKYVIAINEYFLNF